MKTSLIFLAAGQSKRFGGNKQLTIIHGQPMICHCLSTYRQGSEWLAGIDNGVIALGANALEIKKVLPTNIKPHLVKTWEKGMGHTLAESMGQIAKDTSHVLIGLADQILISQPMIEQMLALSNSHPEHIISTKYDGRLGVPAIFPKQYFFQLSRLTGDKGAKDILVQNKVDVISINMPEASIDIDTQDDLKLL